MNETEHGYEPTQTELDSAEEHLATVRREKNMSETREELAAVLGRRTEPREVVAEGGEKVFEVTVPIKLRLRATDLMEPVVRNLITSPRRLMDQGYFNAQVWRGLKDQHPKEYDELMELAEIRDGLDGEDRATSHTFGTPSGSEAKVDVAAVERMQAQVKAIMLDLTGAEPPSYMLHSSLNQRRQSTAYGSTSEPASEE